jgi:hypothetical protein
MEVCGWMDGWMGWPGINVLTNSYIFSWFEEVWRFDPEVLIF